MNDSIGYNPPIPTDVATNRENKAVLTALNVVNNAYVFEKTNQDSKNYWIQQLFESGFEITSPDGNAQISSKMLQQALWRLMSRTKILDFSLHGTGASPDMEALVTAGFSTILEDGGAVQAFRDKDGVFFKQYLYGDGFIQVGTSGEDAEYPIAYSTVSNTNFYVDQYATSIHGAGNGKNATQVAIVYSYSLAEAQKIYPEFKRKKAGVGRIPRDISVWKDLERTYQQTTEIQGDLVEVCHFFDAANDVYVVFAGQQCTVLKELRGSKYPFKLRGKSIIPVFQFMCMASSEGLYNRGIGAMIFDLALVSAKLLNLEVNHVIDNTYPVTLVSVPKDESTQFFNKLAIAYEQRDRGYKATVAMEYDPNNPGANSVQAQSLLTNNLVNEWQLIYETLTRELARLGIVLDDADRGANVTATQIEAEEESQSAFVKQVQEYNASEFKLMLDYSIELIKETVPSSDPTPINLTTAIELEDGTTIKPEGITLGMIADELRKRKYFIRVNSRSGAIPSQIYKKAQVNSIMPYLPPGSPAQLKAVREIARLSDQDFTLEELGGNPGKLESQQPLATETDRLEVNARSDAQVPV